MKVTNIKLEKLKTDPASKELSPFIKLMTKYGVNNPEKMLPTGHRDKVSFDLENTNSSFANAIRRTLIEELPVRALDFSSDSLRTDDAFIRYDHLRKNINLLPIDQTFDERVKISLDLTNTYDENIYIYARDITVRQSKNIIDIKKLIPDSCIIIGKLRPGQSVNISEMNIVEGYSKDAADKFTLLENVSYDIKGETPYDIYSKTGKRSSEVDPVNFTLSFTTPTNVSAKYTINMLADVLRKKFSKAKKMLKTYQESKEDNYFSEYLEVSIDDDKIQYKFPGEYVVLAYCLAYYAYQLDPSIAFCSPAIDRYDNEIAYVRMLHSDSTALLMTACDKILEDITVLHKSLLSKV